MNISISWQTNFQALKEHVAQTGHFPNKHTKLNNWCRYQRKRIKAGMMPDEQRVLFEALGRKAALAYGWETEKVLIL